MAKKDKLKNKSKATPVVPLSGVWGIAILFVAVSIAFANYRVYFGTDDIISKIMLIPSSIAVVGFLVYKATK